MEVAQMLLDELISLLSDQNGSLEAALLKTKVLLHQIGKKDLVPWVSYELAGYPDDVELPDYRTVASQPHGHITSYTWQHKDWMLPTGHLTEKQRKQIQETQIRSSIGTIEQHIKTYHQKDLGLIRNLPPEYGALFMKALQPGVNIMSLWCTVNMAEVEAILVQVRSRLLDFCLELQGVVGIEAPAQQLVAKSSEIDTTKMFHTTIYGGTVIMGSHAFEVNNQQGDIDGLIDAVAKLGYEKDALDGLRLAVIEDKSKGTTPAINEGATGRWFKSAIAEAGKGIVKAGVDVASGVIVKALQHYISAG